MADATVTVEGQQVLVQPFGADALAPIILEANTAKNAAAASAVDAQGAADIAEGAAAGLVAANILAAKSPVGFVTEEDPFGRVSRAAMDDGAQLIAHLKRIKSGDLTDVYGEIDTLQTQMLAALGGGVFGANSGNPGFARPLTVGEWTGTGTATLGTAVTCAIGGHFRQRAVLVGGKINANGAGTLVLQRARISSDAERHELVGIALSLAVPGAGAFTFNLGDLTGAYGDLAFMFEPGEVCGFGGTCGIKYTATAEPHLSWATAALSGAGTATGWVLDAASGKTFDLELYFMLAPADDQAAHALLEEEATFSAVPSGWRNNASATASADALVLATTGFANQLSTGKSSCLHRRSIEFDFQFGTTGSTLGFGTDPLHPADSGSFLGSYLELRASDGQLWAYHTWDGGTTKPAVDTGDKYTLTDPAGHAFAPAANHTYTVRVEKIERDIRVTVSDPTGLFFASVTLNNPTYDYSIQSKYGLMQGAPSFSVAAGSAKLLALRHFADYREFPAWYVNGHSLVEGFLCNDATKPWATQFGLALGVDLVAIDSAGGRNSNGCMVSLFNDLQHMWPQNIAICITGNGGSTPNFTTNINTIARMIRDRGATAVYCVAYYDSGHLAACEAAADAYGGVVSLQYAATGSDTAYYPSAPGDLIHTNALGQTQWFNRFKRDAASLIARSRAA